MVIEGEEIEMVIPSSLKESQRTPSSFLSKNDSENAGASKYYNFLKVYI